MIIFLVGYMGCGKSSIGRALASRLNIQFLDMDPLIEQHCGKSIREIFASEGEEGFRLHEKEVLAEIVAEQQECIVATGGGAPLLLRQHGGHEPGRCHRLLPDESGETCRTTRARQSQTPVAAGQKPRGTDRFHSRQCREEGNLLSAGQTDHSMRRSLR